MSRDLVSEAIESFDLITITQLVNYINTNSDVVNHIMRYVNLDKNHILTL